MMYFRAFKPLAQVRQGESAALWVIRAYQGSTTRAEPHGGDEEELEVLAGRLCPAVMKTSLGGWTPIRASQTTTQAVPGSRSQHNIQPMGKLRLTLRRMTARCTTTAGTATIDSRSQADGRLAQGAAEFSDARTHRGSTRHLQGGFGGSFLTIPCARDEKTLVFVCCVRDCHPITIGNGKSAVSHRLVSRA